MDISNWTLASTGLGLRGERLGLTAHLPEGSKLRPGCCYVVETPVAARFTWWENWLDWTKDGIALRNAQGRLVDWTPDLTDDGSGGIPEIWQRLPEGQTTHAPSAWVFK